MLMLVSHPQDTAFKKNLYDFPIGGEYCDNYGLSSPSGTCDAGYYCSGGATVAAPSGVGGDRCTAGYFCPVGSSAPMPCTPGHYCGTDGLNETSGICHPGYYCASVATVPNPADGNVTGGVLIFSYATIDHTFL